MRVLVVEDEVRLAAAVALGLRAEGFDVDVVHDGGVGLRRACEGVHDAIVLDLLLPTMNGWEVCEALRRAGVWTPILMLTAKDGEYDEAESLDVGADDFLSKPFSYVVLVARLRALVRRGGRERPPVLVVDDLQLDPAARECTRGASRVELTHREFSLLEVLMRRAGEVVSKQELLDRVWGLDFAGGHNVVEVYVRYLRRKIDEPFRRSTLETVRGVGYRLRAPRSGA
jgi:two-component system OmpR family response regulator